MKTPRFKNTTFELGVIIRKQTKNRPDKRYLIFWSGRQESLGRQIADTVGQP